MKALRKLENGPGHVAVTEVPRPEPGPGQVLVEVARAGVCGTDIHILHDQFGKTRPPVTLGHEFAGTVVGLGQGLTGIEPGLRVVVESEAYSCGKCDHCLEGENNLCTDRLAYGYSMDGGFASHVVVRADALHPLADSVSFSEAALGEPLAVAAHAVMEIGAASPGQRVLVAGPGTIGQIVCQVLKSAGAEVILTGVGGDEAKLTLALDQGVDHCLRADDPGLVEAVMDLTEGKGVDAAYECAGAGPALRDCLQLLKRKGELIQVGLYSQPIEINLDPIALKELAVKGTFAHHPGSWVKATELLARGAVDLKPLVSGEFPLEDWRTAFELFERGDGIKYLLYSK